MSLLHKTIVAISHQTFACTFLTLFLVSRIVLTHSCFRISESKVRLLMPFRDVFWFTVRVRPCLFLPLCTDCSPVPAAACCCCCCLLLQLGPRAHGEVGSRAGFTARPTGLSSHLFAFNASRNNQFTKKCKLPVEWSTSNKKELWCYLILVKHFSSVKLERYEQIRILPTNNFSAPLWKDEWRFSLFYSGRERATNELSSQRSDKRSGKKWGEFAGTVYNVQQQKEKLQIIY